MKKLLLTALALISTFGNAQGVRNDLAITSTAANVPVGAAANVMTVPNAIVTLCNYPATGSPCTNTVPVYSDIALTQPIDNPIQADAKGRVGYFVAPGLYSYTVQTQTGRIVGQYTLNDGAAVPFFTPVSSSAACVVPQQAYDANFFYVCTATNVWKRIALTSF